MNKNYLEIDLSRSKEENDGEDLMKIKLKSGNTVQFNFSRFFFCSKYLLDKYSEMMKSIEREIVEVENKYNMKEEIIEEFIEIITKDKVFIPIEHYKDIYTLSKHFCIDKLTKFLDNKKDELFLNDLNFSIQILQDNKDTEIELCKEIENFLTRRLKECMKNSKFKELPIATIYRIINSAITTNHETVDINKLFDFIVESTKKRFILFKFVELDRLSKDKLDEFIKFIDELDSTSKQIYSKNISFNIFFIKEMKREYEELSKLFQQNQTEIKQTKEKLKQR